MKTIKSIFTAVLLFSFCINTHAQTEQLLDKVPTTKEAFVSSEPKVIATINWLENTPLNQEVDKRKIEYTLLMGWAIKSPTVTLDVSANILTFTKENPDLLMIFMGGWVRYCLQNNYSTDNVKGNLAGIRSAIKVYNKGIGIKRDKEMEKLIALNSNGTLEKWVRDGLDKKDK